MFTDGLIDEGSCDIYVVKYNSAIVSEEVLPFVKTFMYLKVIILSEISQRNYLTDM